MSARIFDLSDESSREESISRAVDILRSGGLLAIPTETVYGLGANALDEGAVERIFLAKGRPQDNPLLIHVPDDTWLEQYCRDIPEEVYRLTEAFWPGPLTLVLRRREIIPNRTVCGMDTVGVRCPDNDVCREIIRRAGFPVAAPSANISGRPSGVCASDVMEDLGDVIQGIADDGPCSIGVESTILDMTVAPPRILRAGGMSLEAIRELVPNVVLDKCITEALKEGEKPKAPGMKYRHYAPKAPVRAVAGDAGDTAEYILQHISPGDGVICYEEYVDLFKDYICYSIGPELLDGEHSRRVFGALRYFDSTDAATIWAQCPGMEGLDLAVSNRIKKAAGFDVIYV